MKVLAVCLVFTILVFGVSGSVIGKFNLDIDLHIVKVVSNKSTAAIPLYPEDDSQYQAVSTLNPGKTLPFAYTGKSGDWKYARLNSDVVLIRNDGAELMYQIYQRWQVPERWMDYVYVSSIVGAVILLCTMLFFLVVTGRKQHRFIDVEEVDYYIEQTRLKATENSQLKELLNTQNRQFQINERAFRDKAQQEKARLRKELKKIADIESEARHQASIREMQSSYDRLFEKYQRIKREAVDFGIDFDDPAYEQLLKGRRYELCVAMRLLENDEFKILEWTPDKGFESNIPVSANTNPDLIVEDQSGKTIAIECKYRSGYYFKSKKKEISWSNVDQAKRYKAFSESRNMAVLIALGFDRDPRNPKHHYLVPLMRLMNDSRKDDPNGKGDQLIISQSDIYHDYVKKGQYARYLKTFMAIDS